MRFVIEGIDAETIFKICVLKGFRLSTGCDKEYRYDYVTTHITVVDTSYRTVFSHPRPEVKHTNVFIREPGECCVTVEAPDEEGIADVLTRLGLDRKQVVAFLDLAASGT